MTKLEELKAAYGAATPGEWKACRSHEEFTGLMFEIDEEDRVYYESRPFTHIRTETETVAAAHDLFEFERTDATFIALSHNLMPALLEAVEKLEYLNSLCSDYNDEYWATPAYRETHALLEKLK